MLAESFPFTAERRPVWRGRPHVNGCAVPAAVDELRGTDLLCFCAPAACHGDLLLRLANATREERIAWWRSAA
jgi:Domain of unknown function (DUF4326)